MALTRDFTETVRDRAQSDPTFRAALLSEAIELLLSGDVETGRTLLRDYINATIGFIELGQKSGLPPKSLMRMFGPSGNPRAQPVAHDDQWQHHHREQQQGTQDASVLFSRPAAQQRQP